MNIRNISPSPIKKWVGVTIFFLMNSALFAAEMTMNVSCQTYPSPYLSDWATIPGIVNITITYTGSVPDTVRLEGSAVSREHGEIVSGQSDNIIIPGAQTIRRDNRDFLNYKNIKYSETYTEQLTRTGRLLEGTYTLYMKLVKVNTGTVVSEKSCLFYILSFNQPSLIAPANGDTTLIVSPTFQWTQATAHPGFTVRYHFRLCEVGPGQTPQEAMSNIAFHEQVIENSTSFIYPNTARALVTGKAYVWQVQSTDRNNIPIGANEGRSEIWRFQKAEITFYHPVMRPIYQPKIGISKIVNRVNNYFEVILEITNQDSLTFDDLTIYSMNLGFQGRRYCEMRKRNADGTWPAWHGYLYVGNITNSRKGNKFQWQGRISHLKPDSVLQVKYHVSPVLFSIGERPREYTICDSFRITCRVEGREYLKRLAGMRYTNAAEVSNAFHAADYLIVTCPSKLFDYNPDTDTTVNRLLGTMAELAELKNGVLGYIPYSWSDVNLKWEISRGQTWANSMCPGWVEGNGYLLIVGEREIVPMYNYWVDPSTGTAEPTDYAYTNTDIFSDERPELKVGRILGVDAASLSIPITNSILVYRREAGHSYHVDEALLVSGCDNDPNIQGPYMTQFIENIRSSYIPRAVLLHWSNYSSLSARSNAFKARALGKGLIFYSDHGGTDSWCGGLDAWPTSECPIEPLDLRGEHPIVFATACATGKYWDVPSGHESIARVFLENGAAVYIGITWGLGFGHFGYGERFAALYSSPHPHIGDVFKSMQAEKILIDPGWRNVVCRYHLYGDPKFGRR